MPPPVYVLKSLNESVGLPVILTARLSQLWRSLSNFEFSQLDSLHTR